MTKPWEANLLQALRDAQWLSLQRSCTSPERLPLLLKLDGTTEATLGDVLFEASGVFYLFEAKSSRSGIPSEWNKKLDGQPHPKRIFTTLGELLKKTAADPADDYLQEILLVSQCCHYFVYWSDEVFEEQDPLGSLLVEPYVSACARGEEPGYVAPELVADRVAERARSGPRFLLDEMLPFSAVIEKRGYFAKREPNQMRRFALGATARTFETYLNYLVEHAKGGDGSLNAIVWSEVGFAKAITSVDQLRKELIRRPPAPQRTMKPARTSIASKDLPSGPVPRLALKPTQYPSSASRPGRRVKR